MSSILPWSKESRRTRTGIPGQQRYLSRYRYTPREDRYNELMADLGMAYLMDMERENEELKAQVRFWQKLYVGTTAILLMVLLGAKTEAISYVLRIFLGV